MVNTSQKEASQSDHILERLMALHPKIIDLKLDRVYRLLEALGNPHEKLPPVIHIAGTNGKGSTLAYVRACLEEAGLRCHHYVSPHLVRFHERITLAGELIEEDALVALLARCEKANDGAPITYFEITTVAALLAFSEVEADYCLLETGLGGRLDATNVIDQPALTIITPISMDHSQFLGDTIAAIAGEKAGILKPDVPAIIAPQPDEAEAVFAERGKGDLGPEIHLHDQDWSYDGQKNSLRIGGTSVPLEIRPSMPGAHQQQNAQLAAASMIALNDDRISLPDIERGIRKAQWLGRLTPLNHGVWRALLGPNQELWIDGGHNQAAGVALAAHARDAWGDAPLHVVYGMLNTKDAGGFLAPIAEVADSLSAIEIPHQSASLSADEAAKAHPRAKAFAGLEESLTALNQEKSRSRVLVTGSLYLVGWLLGANQSNDVG